MKTSHLLPEECRREIEDMVVELMELTRFLRFGFGRKEPITFSTDPVVNALRWVLKEEK